MAPDDERRPSDRRALGCWPSSALRLLFEGVGFVVRIDHVPFCASIVIVVTATTTAIAIAIAIATRPRWRQPVDDLEHGHMDLAVGLVAIAVGVHLDDRHHGHLARLHAIGEGLSER